MNTNNEILHNYLADLLMPESLSRVNALESVSVESRVPRAQSLLPLWSGGLTKAQQFYHDLVLLSMMQHVTGRRLRLALYHALYGAITKD